MMICKYCGESFKDSEKKIVEHVNIAQKTKRHRFCSPRCKDKWSLQVQNKKSRMIVIWAIGSYIDQYYFIKKLMKVHSPSLLGSEIKKVISNLISTRWKHWNWLIITVKRF